MYYSTLQRKRYTFLYSEPETKRENARPYGSQDMLVRSFVLGENAEIVRKWLTGVCPRRCLALGLDLVRCSFLFAARNFYGILWCSNVVAAILFGLLAG